MKNLYLIFLIAGFCLLNNLAAQENTATEKRCGTAWRLGELSKKYPQRRLAARLSATGQTQNTVTHREQLSTEIYIPIVVHIVLPNPYMVTDADVQAQIDRLNLDFSGLNPDSTNVPTEFTRLRGHSRIRFCLARQTPDGRITSGIERRSSTTGSDIGADRDPIKFSVMGGLDAWDPTRYLNYWVGIDATGTGVLGYAQFPSSTIEAAETDGVVINYQAWGTNPCYTWPSYNKGRTAVHETGHFLGLLHVSGDDGNTCTGDDFDKLTNLGSACVLPAGVYNETGQGNTANDVGDTPNQANHTEGCPSTFIVTDACSGQAPGVMYQNFMDYSDDACLSLFTKKQVERMEAVLLNCRSGLTTSNACQPPANAVSLDAAPVQAVSPGGMEINNCVNTFYPSVLLCAGMVQPKIRVANLGQTTINSLTVGYRLNNGAAVSQVFSVNLPLGASAVVSFPAVAVGVGDHKFTFFTSNPNGAADQVTLNDSLTQNLQVLGTVNAPLQQDFENSNFPPAGWAVDNYNQDFTWERRSPGNNSSGAMFINNYEVDATENLDDFKSSRINVAGADSVIISFDLAHKEYPEEGFSDTLTVLITKDCGQTFQTVYKKWGAELATAGSSSDPYLLPEAGDWRREKIVLTANAIGGSSLSVIFRNTTRYGNNVFIDNINIEAKKTNVVLQRRGYLIFPTVFSQQFGVVWREAPADLKAISVYNSIGQLIYQKLYNGSTESFIAINLLGRPAGSYLVRLSYADSSKDVSQWMIKQN